MIYTNRYGEQYTYRETPTFVTRTIQFHPNDPEHWEERDLLDVIWEAAGNLVSEVRVESVYRNPDTGQVTRAYDLRIMTGQPFLYGRTAVNNLIVKIEELIAERLPVTGATRTKNVKVVVPNPSFKSRRKMFRITSPC